MSLGESLSDILIDISLPLSGSLLLPFEAYFDESYTDSGVPLLAFGGYVIEKNAAKEMSRRWSEILVENDIPYFHMNEFGPGKSEIYKHLTLEKRIDIQSRLLGLIANYVSQGIGLIINPKRYDDGSVSNIYASCAQIAFDMAITFLDTAAPNQKLSIILERGHVSDGRAVEAMASAQKKHPELYQRITAITLGAKADYPMLQAADLLAWQTAKYIKDKVSKIRKPRMDYQALVKKKHVLFFLSIQNKIITLSHVHPSHTNPKFEQFLQGLFNNGEKADLGRELINGIPKAV